MNLASKLFPAVFAALLPLLATTTPQPAAAQVSTVGTLYTTTVGTTSRLFVVNPSTGEAARISSATQFGVGESEPGGLAAIGNTLYMIGTTNDALYTVDTATGAAARVGSATKFGVNEGAPSGLAAIGNTLYMSGGDTYALYTVDTGTGVATRVGMADAFGAGERSATGLASIGNTLYMSGGDTDALYTVDTGTGVATRVGSDIAFRAGESFPAGLAAIGNTLYMLGARTKALYTVDTATGRATRVTPFNAELASISVLFAGYGLAFVPGSTPNFTPVFSTENTQFQTRDNSTGGTTIGTAITARDANGDTIRYSLSGGGSTDFSVDGNGQITVAAGVTLDAQTTPSYTLTLSASDGASQSTVPVNISVRPEGNIYAVGTRNDALYLLDSFTHINRRIGDARQFGVGEGDPGPLVFINGTLYMIGNETKALYTINRSTGVATKVANMAIPAHGLTTLGGVVYMISGTNLYTLNTSTGATTMIGDTGVGSSGITAVENTLYLARRSFDFGKDETILYEVNKTTGEATLVHPPRRTNDICGDGSCTTYLADGLITIGDRIFTAYSPPRIDRGFGIPGVVPARPRARPRPFFGLGIISRTSRENGGLQNARTGRLSLMAEDMPTGLAFFPGTTVNHQPTFSDYRPLHPFFALSPNTPGGTNLGRPITATDADGDSLRYALSGAGSSNFEVDSGGQISVAGGAGFNHAITPSYTLTLTASDSGGLRSALPVTIHILPEGTMYGLSNKTHRVGVIPPGGLPTESYLTSVDINTGRLTRVGNATDYGIGENDPGGLATIGSTLYMVGKRADALYTVDRNTGRARRVGNATRFGVEEHEPSALAAIGNTLYMLGDRNNALYSLNPATGIAQRIGNADGFGVGEFAPSALAAIGNTLYMLGAETDALYTLDTNTGIATRIGNATRFGVEDITQGEFILHNTPRGLTAVGDALFMTRVIQYLFNATDLPELYIVNTSTGTARGIGRQSRDVVGLAFAPPNNAPNAVIVSPTITLNHGQNPPHSIVVDASTVFIDAERDALTFTATSSASNIAAANANGDNITISAVNIGNTVVAIFANDGGSSTRLQYNVIVQAPAANAPPTANAGADQTAAEGATVALRGNATDPENQTLTYAWTQINIGNGPRISINDANRLNANFVAPNNLVSNLALQFQFSAQDPSGASAADQVQITVTGVNAPPTVNAGADQTVGEGAAVSLQGGAVDSEGQSIAYAWTQTAGPEVTLNAANTAIANFTAPNNLTTNVTLQFRLSARDTGGAGAADNVQITVTGNNESPLANAGVDQTVAEGAAVSLQGSASDPENETITYNWEQINIDDGPRITLAGANTPNASFTAPANLLTNTILQFRFSAQDATGASAMDDVQITVTGVNAPPVANAGANQSVAEGATVNLQGSAVDSEGESITYAWTQTAGNPVTLRNANNANANFTAPDNLINDALFQFRLSARDASGESATDDVQITVIGVNAPPVVNAGTDQNALEGDTITLQGSATDSENEALSYEWMQIGTPAVTLTGAESNNASFTAPDISVRTVLTFRLTASDASGASGTDVLRVSLTPVSPRIVDSNSNGIFDGDDAAVMNAVFLSNSMELFGDGISEGSAQQQRNRQALLSGAVGSTDDSVLRAVILNARMWKRIGVLAEGDIDGNGATDEKDALILYHVHALGNLVGDSGENSGHPHWRRALLGALAPEGANATDAQLRALIRRAREFSAQVAATSASGQTQ